MTTDLRAVKEEPVAAHLALAGLPQCTYADNQKRLLAPQLDELEPMLTAQGHGHRNADPMQISVARSQQS